MLDQRAFKMGKKLPTFYMTRWRKTAGMTGGLKNDLILSGD